MRLLLLSFRETTNIVVTGGIVPNIIIHCYLLKPCIFLFILQQLFLCSNCVPLFGRIPFTSLSSGHMHIVESHHSVND